MTNYNTLKGDLTAHAAGGLKSGHGSSIAKKVTGNSNQAQLGMTGEHDHGKKI